MGGQLDGRIGRASQPDIVGNCVWTWTLNIKKAFCYTGNSQQELSYFKPWSPNEAKAFLLNPAREAGSGRRVT